MTGLSQVVQKSVTSKCKVVSEDKQQSVVLDAPQQGRSLDTAKWPKYAMFSAYWQVNMSPHMDEVNMKASTATSNGWVFPIWINAKALKPWDRLVAFDKAQAAKLEVAAKKRKIA